MKTLMYVVFVNLLCVIKM